MLSHEAHDTEGCQDLGAFFLDVSRKYAPENVLVRWCDKRRSSNPQVDEIIERMWSRQVQRAETENINLYNGRLCRLVDCAAGEKELTLTVAAVSYKEFLGTNLTQPHLRYVHGPEVLADPLGVSAAVVSADNFIVLGRRSKRQFFNAGKIDAIGGMVEPTENTAQEADPCRAMLDELSQELNLSAEAVGRIECLGLVRDKSIVQPELIYDMPVNVEMAKIRELAARARDAEEHDELVTLANDPSAVVAFIDQHHDEITPVALATLLLHGMNCWGSGWFTTARGYLHTVI